MLGVVVESPKTEPVRVVTEPVVFGTVVDAPKTEPLLVDVAGHWFVAADAVDVWPVRAVDSGMATKNATAALKMAGVNWFLFR